MYRTSANMSTIQPLNYKIENMITNRLSAILGEKRLKIKEVAQLAELDYTTVYNLYHDNTTRIDFKTIDRLCSTLNCTTQDLLRYTPDK